MPKRPWTPRVLLFYNSSCLSDRAVRRVEESWFGFLIAGGLCSKPGSSLCERIKLTFATAPGCLHSLSLGRHDRFGRLCNQFLPKTLRFSLQRHKTAKSAAFCGCLPLSVLECFLAFGSRHAVSEFSASWIQRLWLVALDRLGV